MLHYEVVEFWLIVSESGLVVACENITLYAQVDSNFVWVYDLR